ncbi:ABC transporter permease [Conexibacter woesei]|uniref:Binding-protein-dependent transport systems inner membrane component n=1 Tax=Conexibacter woesei (strain DSM 14684 / CCUG 47730 / CIP 108061 / JCM 11494 / NBRC 100937 / ID131577) TaxID=469383 RepID=D3F7R3_CONWI|nr:ABC transporter permease [Conexibacter woesei]ADB50925.1 binding-protein-dependent transport systems inner membrane component [Conexibacter woesei DSM 14684]
MAATDVLTPEAPALERPREKRRWLTPRLVLGLTLFLAPLVLSLLARFAIDRGETEIFAFDPKLEPGDGHPLGTDGSGRDVLAVIVYSTAPTFQMALVAGLAATLIGTAAGLVSGYMRGAPDTLVRGISDVMIGIPAFAMLILVAAVMGDLSLLGLALVIALFTWPLVARAVRAQVLTLREQPFVTISRLSNRSPGAIMAFELLPNLLTLVTAMFVGAISGALAIAIGLQLIGLGPIDTQTLGLALQNALSAGALSQGLWWWWLPPAALLIVFFVGLFLVSLAVDEIANPRLRKAGRNDG